MGEQKHEMLRYRSSKLLNWENRRGWRKNKWVQVFKTIGSEKKPIGKWKNLRTQEFKAEVSWKNGRRKKTTYGTGMRNNWFRKTTWFQVKDEKIGCSKYCFKKKLRENEKKWKNIAEQKNFSITFLSDKMTFMNETTADNEFYHHHEFA